MSTKLRLATLVVVAAIGAAAFSDAASANDARGSIACHPGSAWANDPPRIAAWPFLMQRTPGFAASFVSYNNGTYSLLEYTAQWLWFRVWANGVPGAWLAGTDSIGAGASPLNSFVEVQPGVWRQAAMFHWDGSGPEDYSFIRLASRGGMYDVWLEFVWGPIYAKSTGRLAYAGERKWVYKGRIGC